MNRFLKILFSSILLATICFGAYQNVSAAAIPNTSNADWSVDAKDDPSLSSFIHSVASGRSDLLTGIYVSDTMAFPVAQQPANNAGFVSTQPGTLTQFSLASQYGTIGLLAHNTLAGANFTDIDLGDRITLVYGDGSVHYYKVTQIDTYQALSPNSPYSSFVNLENPGKKVSATDLFFAVYGQGNRLVMQTCIDNEGVSSWGRLFITAQPYNPVSEYVRSAIRKEAIPM